MRDQRWIACIPTGVHPGHKRFPDRIDRPEIKAWRCDLTALSQIYNLYFLACNDTIHVYQPIFPDQNLSSEPQLIIYLPVSPQTGNGIDPQDPHSVTRILVGYLGCDEILLVACDDGDVVGYRVDEIQRSLDERMSSTDSSRRSPHEDGAVRFFLHRNVGASAWGLAVHRAARIIAISANTHRITVLAFALSEPLLPCRECLSHTVKPETHTEESQFSRKEDVAFELLGETNIPAVSFDNTGDDPSGHWLFSCSIDGVTTVWNLHKPDAPCTVFRFGFCASALTPSSAPRLGPGQCACIDSGNVPHGVWGALPLDTRSAHEITIQQRDSLRSCMVEPCFRVIVEQRKRFTKRRPKRSVFEQLPGHLLPDDNEHDDVMVLDDESEAGTSNSETESGQEMSSQLDATMFSDGMSVEASIEEGNQSHENDPAAIAAGITNISHTHEASSSSSIASDSSFGPGSSLQANFGQGQLQPQWDLLQPLSGPPWSQTAAPDYDELNQDDTYESVENGVDYDSANEEAYFASTFPNRLPRKRAYCEISTPQVPIHDRPFATPVRPCLVVTKEEIYLIERPSPSSRIHPPDSIVTMRRPIHPGYLSPYIASYDRLCYLTQIPELALFIVASPIGRAAVFTLHFTKAQPQSDPEYGFTLQYLLPFDPENNSQLLNVPNARLLGIAVAPVQGMSDVLGDTAGAEQRRGVPQLRRWRLLMYYTDHTVLSFELSKPRHSATPDMTELVV